MNRLLIKMMEKVDKENKRSKLYIVIEVKKRDAKNNQLIPLKTDC